MNEREFLRHVLATLAYRGGKFLKGAPPDFAHFDGPGGRAVAEWLVQQMVAPPTTGAPAERERARTMSR